MTLRALMLATALLGLPSASYAACVKLDGFVSCPNGASGFEDSSGNLWTRERRGREGVIINLDGPQRAPTRSSGTIQTVPPDGGVVELE